MPTKIIFSFLSYPIIKFFSLFFFILFPLLKKYAKKLDHQKLASRMARSTARMMVSPRSQKNKHLCFGLSFLDITICSLRPSLCGLGLRIYNGKRVSRLVLISPCQRHYNHCKSLERSANSKDSCAQFHVLIL